MATSPTVLAGASTSSLPAPAPVAPKVPIVPLLIAVVVGVVLATLGVGGVVYYLARTGRFPIREPQCKRQGPLPRRNPRHGTGTLLVNLADAGGRSYLRVSL